MIDSLWESDVDIARDTKSLEWLICTEFEEVPGRTQFVPGEKPAGLQMSLNISQPVHFLDLYITSELINEIKYETNNYVKKSRKNACYQRIRYRDIGMRWPMKNSGHLLA